MKVTKTFTFDAGHRLSDYEGKCRNFHGHTYLLEVTLEGEPINNGMVLDFGILKEVVKKIVDESFDHKMILKDSDPINIDFVNVLPEDMAKAVTLVAYNPTAENMAKDIFERIEAGLADQARVANVRLFETPTSYADYSK